MIAEPIATTLVPVATAMPEAPKQTLADLLRLLTDSDESLIADFDPAEIVGDVRDKVDAIEAVLSRLEFQEAWCRQCAAPFLKKAQALAKNRQRLRDYVVWAMQQEKFQTVPGNVFKVEIRSNPPALEITQPEASATDFVRYPNYVKQVRYYAWDEKAIKDALVSQRNAASEEDRRKLVFEVEGMPFARLTIGQRPEFKPNTPEKIEGSKKRAKKGAAAG